jgi:hypothetical protein
MYKLAPINKSTNEELNVVIRVADHACIPFYLGNTDYANFKTAILEDKAQLQDADGNAMTAEQAKDFVKELP